MDSILSTGEGYRENFFNKNELNFVGGGVGWEEVEIWLGKFLNLSKMNHQKSKNKSKKLKKKKISTFTIKT